MKIWIIKHKGKNWWGNMGLDNEISDGNTTVNSQPCFYRRKDALWYMKTKKYTEFYEVVGATLDESTQDNRKTP